MNRMVVRDYFSTFRWSNLKACYKENSLFAYVWLLWYVPLITGLYEEELEDWLKFLVVYAVLFFGMFAALLHPIELPKMMFLCPMSEAERRDYVMKSWLFKVIFPIALSILGMGALVLLDLTDLFWAAATIVVAAAGSLCTSFQARADVNRRGKGGNKKSMLEGHGVWESTGIVVSVIFDVLILMLSLQDNPTLVGKSVIAAGILLLELPVAIKLLCRVKPAIDRAMSYERSYVREENKE